MRWQMLLFPNLQRLWAAHLAPEITRWLVVHSIRISCLCGRIPAFRSWAESRRMVCSAVLVTAVLLIRFSIGLMRKVRLITVRRDCGTMGLSIRLIREKFWQWPFPYRLTGHLQSRLTGCSECETSSGLQISLHFCDRQEN